MLYRHVFDKISTEFRGILRVFVNFAALRRREISEALTTSCIIYTNWRLKIYIWRLHFSSWSPKGDLRIFLISSPAHSIIYLGLRLSETETECFVVVVVLTYIQISVNIGILKII